MSDFTVASKRFDELMGVLFEEGPSGLSCEEKVELDALVGGYDFLLERYVSLIDTHGMLKWGGGLIAGDEEAYEDRLILQGVIEEAEANKRRSEAEAIVSAEAVELAMRIEEERVKRLAACEVEPRRVIVIPRVVVVAAAILFVVMAGLIFSVIHDEKIIIDDEVVVVEPGEKVDVVWGEIVKSQVAVWDDTFGVVKDGELRGGEYYLREGMVEIRLRSGVLVVLESPVRFGLGGENFMRLDVGRLVADVPKGAEGFRVVTPESEVVDYGTRFGVKVSADRGSEVLVFDGEIGVSGYVANGVVGGERRVFVGQGVRVAEVGSDAVLAKFDSSLFIETVPDSAYGLEVLKARPMCYWSLGDGGVGEVKDRGWLGADAAVVGEFMGERIGGVGDGMRFDGEKNSLRVVKHDRLSLRRDFTMGAWVFIEGGAENYMRVISNRSASGGVGLGVAGSIDRARERSGIFSIFNGMDYFTKEKLPMGKWVHLMVTVDGSQDVGFWVDGVKVEVEGRVDSVSDRVDDDFDQLMIGRNPLAGGVKEFWRGGIGEVVIFDRVLKGREIKLMADFESRR